MAAADFALAVSYASFIHLGVEYSFAHLDKFEMEIEDSGKVIRRIEVSFSDHVFTKSAIEGDDPRHVYPGSTRKPPGHFCEIRYALSRKLPELIRECAKGIVWNLGGGDESYAQIPTVDHLGRPVLYAIVFSLDPVSGKNINLHMRVRSAYPCEGEPPSTFGTVKFRHLAALRMQRKHPKKVFDRKRRVPHLSKPVISVGAERSAEKDG